MFLCNLDMFFYLCMYIRIYIYNTQLIKDWHLILLVLAILAVEVVALAILMAINSTRYSVREIPDKEHPGLHDLVIICVLLLHTP